MKTFLLAFALVMSVASQSWGQGFAPRMITQTFVLADLPNPTQNFNLTSKPILGTGAKIVILFTSSRMGNDVSAVVTPGATTPKVLQVIVPEYRPFINEILTVIYWTYE